MKNLFFLAFIFLFSSCLVFRSGSVSSGPLLSVNDQYADVARGEASAYSVLIFADVDRTSLIYEAKKNLFKNRPLNGNEYYSNFSTDINRHIYLGIVYRTIVVMHADVMRKSDTARPTVTPGERKEKEKPTCFDFNGLRFCQGETIYYSRNKIVFTKGKITQVEDGNISFTQESSLSSKFLKISRNTFYSTIARIKDFAAGDSVRLDDFDPISAVKKIKKAVIVGVNNEEALLQINSRIESCSYNKLYSLK